MTTQRTAVLSLAITLTIGASCSSGGEPCIPTPGEQWFARLTPPFSVLESELVIVVVTTDAPKTPRNQLLAITDRIHRARDAKGGTTIVIFRDPTKPLPNRPLARAEQFAHAFAIGRIDPAQGIREVLTDRIFN